MNVIYRFTFGIDIFDIYVFDTDTYCAYCTVCILCLLIHAIYSNLITVAVM